MVQDKEGVAWGVTALVPDQVVTVYALPAGKGYSIREGFPAMSIPVQSAE